MEEKKCLCNCDNDLVISCSGAADVGYIADQTARKLNRNKVRKMSCLAMFATYDEQQVKNLKDKNILLIDGCSEDCGKKILEKIGVTNYKYLRINDLGYEKGKTPTSQQVVNDVYSKAELMF